MDAYVFGGTSITVGGEERLNEMRRYEAYKVAAGLLYGRQGRGNRLELPTCVVNYVHFMYPSPSGDYKGFLSAQE